MSAPCIGMSWRESRALTHVYTCGTQIRNRNLEIHFFIVARRDKEEEDSAAPVPDRSCGQISDGISSSFLRSFFFIFFSSARTCPIHIPNTARGEKGARSYSRREIRQRAESPILLFFSYDFVFCQLILLKLPIGEIHSHRAP